MKALRSIESLLLFPMIGRKIINIQFDAVNYLSEIWINDQAVGYHEGGFTPFEFRVDGMIKVGRLMM